MSQASELYQELILDHHAHPRNFGQLAAPTHRAEGVNPLCGDHLTLTLEVQDGVIRDLRFEGSGCAISRASSSLMTAALKGKSTAEAERLFDAFHDLVAGSGAGRAELLGKLAAFAGVRDFPSRVKCATLAWHTLKSALGASGEVASTE